MKKSGTIVRFDLTRGFGFIRSPASSADTFFHLRDWRDALAPRTGLEVAFDEIHVGGKGSRAIAVHAVASAAKRNAFQPVTRSTHPATGRNFAVAAPRRERRTGGRATRSGPGQALFMLVLTLAWVALLVWGLRAGRLPPATPLAALALNVATFFAYWFDKRAAEQGEWRTTESTLQLLGLLGGWPGAWFAQQLLRHKSSKASFRAAYWGTVVLHCIALSVWIANPALLAGR